MFLTRLRFGTSIRIQMRWACFASRVIFASFRRVSRVKGKVFLKGVKVTPLQSSDVKISGAKNPSPSAITVAKRNAIKSRVRCLSTSDGTMHQKDHVP
jgi:hypothetical protein